MVQKKFKEKYIRTIRRKRTDKKIIVNIDYDDYMLISFYKKL